MHAKKPVGTSTSGCVVLDLVGIEVCFVGGNAPPFDLMKYVQAG